MQYLAAEVQPAVLPISRQFRLVWLDAADVVRSAPYQSIDQSVRLSLSHIRHML